MPLIVHWPDADRRRRRRSATSSTTSTTSPPPSTTSSAITAPDVYRGLEQLPDHRARRWRYTFDDPDAPTDQADRSTTRCSATGRSSRTGGRRSPGTQPGVPFDDDVWELYHLDEDRSECHDLAADAARASSAELVELWWDEAEDQGVLPLDDRTSSCSSPGSATTRRTRPTGTTTYFPPMAPLPAQVAPGARAAGASTWPPPSTGRRGEGGVLFATGTENSGISFFVQDDRLVFDYNCFNDHHVVESDVEVPEGPSVVGVRFRAGRRRRRRPGLLVDGAPCGSAEVPFAMHIISSVGPSVGYDHGSPVSERYAGHFPFEGTLHKVDDRRRPQGRRPPTALEAQQRAAMSQQ